MKVSSTLPEWILVKLLLLAKVSDIVALDNPLLLQAGVGLDGFCDTVPALIRQLVLAANATFASAVEPFVTSLVEVVAQASFLPMSTSKYD
jgi:hypothetical protein